MTLSHLNNFIHKQDLSSLNKAEIHQLELLILNAITEELENPKALSCRMELGIPAFSPAPAVSSILEANGIHLTQGQYHSYLEWRNGILTGQVN